MATKKYHLAILCASTCGFLDLYSTQAIYPVLHARFGIGPAGGGSLITATTMGIAVSSPLAGVIAERIGSRRSAILGLALLIFLSFSISFATGWHALLGLRFVQGLVIPIVLSALLASIHLSGKANDAISVSASYVSGTIAGGIAGRYLPAVLVPTLGWMQAWMLFSGVHLILLMLALPFLPASPPLASSSLPSLRLATVRQAWTASLKAKFAAGFCLLFCQTAVFTYIVLRLSAAPFNLGHASLGALYAVFLPSLLLIRCIPWLRKRLGTKRLLAGAVTGGWCGLLLTTSDVLQLVVAGLTIFSIAVFVMQTVLANEVGTDDSAPKAISAGAYLFFYYLGGSLGALAPALIWPRFGWSGCLALLCLVQIIGFTAGQSYWRRKQFEFVPQTRN